MRKNTPCDVDGICPYAMDGECNCEYWCGGDDAEDEPRYSVMYDGYLFDGDSDGLNIHPYEKWEDVQTLINAYGDIIEVKDNYYDVHWSHGEWYSGLTYAIE